MSRESSSTRRERNSIFSRFPEALTNPRISYFGILSMHVWIHCANRYSDFGGVQPWFGNYSFWLICLLVVAIVVFLKKPELKVPISFDIALMILMSVASLIAGFGLISGNAGLVLLTTMFGGFGFAWGYLRWGLFYSKISLKNAFACIFGAYALGALLKIFLYWVSNEVGIVVMAALPILSLVSWARASMFTNDLAQKEDARLRSTQSVRGAETNSAIIKTFVLTIVYCSVLQVSGTMTASFSFEGTSTIVRVIEIVLSLCVMAWVFLTKRQLQVTWLWGIVIFLVGTMLVAQILGFPAVTRFLFGLTNSLMVMVYWIMFADLAQRSSLSPYVVFGVGRLAYSIPVYGSWLLSNLVGYGELSSWATLPVILLYGILIFSIFLGTNRDPDFSSSFENLDETPPYSLQDVADHCRRVGKEKNLTDREIEIMSFIASGRSKAYIAETLYLSEATIKSHARKIYTKLDVHSKAELQKLIGL